MADTWYLVITTPAPSCDVWPIGDNSDPVVTQAYIDAGCVLKDVPEDWFEFPGWRVANAPGLPHPSLLATATLHEGPPVVP